MKLFKKLIEKIKTLTIGDFKDNNTSAGRADDSEHLLMHMLYREGESDAQYELEHDDYKEVSLLKEEVVEAEELAKLKEECRAELNNAQ